MGKNELSVVDAQLHLRESDNLYIVDGSVLPSLTCGTDSCRNSNSCRKLFCAFSN
ncbi:GMC family oxidoreductase [Brucella sp. HL-2]|nr:GMC family oxidoreductase [Brucella sp. HL-2]MCV9907728.1 GMC family oxidoreductase [Brucella sp. HL-2]